MGITRRLIDNSTVNQFTFIIHIATANRVHLRELVPGGSLVRGGLLAVGGRLRRRLWPWKCTKGASLVCDVSMESWSVCCPVSSSTPDTTFESHGLWLWTHLNGPFLSSLYIIMVVVVVGTGCGSQWNSSCLVACRLVSASPNMKCNPNSLAVIRGGRKVRPALLSSPPGN